MTHPLTLEVTNQTEDPHNVSIAIKEGEATVYESEEISIQPDGRKYVDVGDFVIGTYDIDVSVVRHDGAEGRLIHRLISPGYGIHVLEAETIIGPKGAIDPTYCDWYGTMSG